MSSSLKGLGRLGTSATFTGSGVPMVLSVWCLTGLSTLVSKLELPFCYTLFFLVVGG